MAEQEQQSTSQENARESPIPHSCTADQAVIDLTDDDPNDRAPEQPQISSKSKTQDCSQEEKSSEEDPLTEDLLPEIKQAASMFVEPNNTGPEKDQAQSQESPRKSPKKGERARSRDGQARPVLGEDFKSGTISFSSIEKSQQFQTQDDEPDWDKLYQSVDVDPTIEELQKPLEWQNYDNDQESHNEPGRIETLTRNMARDTSCHRTTPDVMDSTSIENEDDDTIRIGIPVVPATLFAEPQKKADYDPKADSMDSMDTDESAHSADTGIDEEKNKTTESGDKEEEIEADDTMDNGADDIEESIGVMDKDTEQVADTNKGNPAETG